MCGIAGIWSPQLSREERERWMRAMLAALRHRGPSGTAVWSDDQITLGLTRLAIVAPASEADIAAGDSGRVRAVMNGEIYNHMVLRGALRIQGHAVAGPTDTWVIPPLFEREGADFPQRLDGQFGIAVWDSVERRLVLARDRAGEKPLFFARVAGGWAFASEPRALVLLPGISRDPAPEALARYLYHGFFAGSDSAYATIRQLPPAHALVLDAGGEHVKRYWRPWDAGARPASPVQIEDAPARSLAELERAVASRVPDEVPFGVFLSGGVDSGLVATLAARTVRHAFPTFSLRLPHQGYDESGYAAEVAKRIGSEHHVLVMDVAEGAEALEHYAATNDQPLGDPSLLPTWALARLASRHVPVVLTGEGGDELFAGYPTYIGHGHAALAARIPQSLRAATIALARKLSPKHHHVTLPFLLERFLSAADLPPFERHWAWFGTASPAESLAFLAPALRARVTPRTPLAHLARIEDELERAGVIRAGEEPPLEAYQMLDFELFLPGALLTKVDRAAMAHGVESRAPFLEESLIRFALSLPAGAKVRGGVTKWALKQAAHGLLPEAIRARRKQGFSPPFSAWARGPLRAQVAEHLSRERIEHAGVLDAAATTDLFQRHVSGQVERGRTLWALLSLQMWAEKFVAAPAAAPMTPAAAEALPTGA
jgi:asparagine synthase (glutamine-hydrolysing)